MPMYPFKCACGYTAEILWSIHDYANLPVPEHCGQRMEQVVCPSFVKFAQTTGRDSGVYKLDYGLRCTEDLTVPGKMERLKKAGVISDPFDANPAPRRLEQQFAKKRPDQEMIDAFS